MFNTDDTDEREPDLINNEEASYYYMIMDLEHFIKTAGFAGIYNSLEKSTQEFIDKFYASKR